MSRPKKQTVDWFSHDCTHKKTMFIIEGKYGNDGYAFWFKLLEMLGGSEGHYLDLSEPEAWEFLQSKTRLNEDLCREILNLLAKLKAIDPELWEEKVVWSDNFLDRISVVYKNRRVDIPIKPDNYKQKPHADGITTSRKPQRKVGRKESKETNLQVDLFFEEFCSIFPGKVIKTPTLKNWNRRIKEGYTPEKLLATGKKYAEECQRENKKDCFYHASNFFGDKAYYEAYLQDKPEPMTEADRVAARFKAELEAQEAK